MASNLSIGSRVINEGSAGLINGLILCINSFTIGSLLVSHYAKDYVGIAIGSMLIAGMFGSLYGLLSKDKALACGPSGTVASIMAGPTLIFFAGADLDANMLLFPIVLLGLLVALIFYLTARLGVTNLFKFIPYSVFIGLMAASGYLICKGALSISLGASVDTNSFGAFLIQFSRWDVFISLIIAILYIVFSPRISAQILIPGIILGFSLAITLFLGSGYCSTDLCDRSSWFFSTGSSINWIPGWEVNTSGLTLVKFLEFLPTALSVAFICVLSILVSFENLYIWFAEEFDTRIELKNHSILIALSAIFGGFISNLAFQRVILNKKIGGAIWGGVVTCLVAILAFFYIDQIIQLVPRCVIGGFLLYQGIEVMQKSLSNKANLTRVDLAIACLILFLVATHSFVYGFIVGLILSFLYSVISLSRIPLIEKQGDLTDFRSPIIRPHLHEITIGEYGKKFKYFQLEGYLFYGTVTQLDSILEGLNYSDLEGIVIDASKVNGFDTSAKISLGRILARHHVPNLKWYFVANESLTEGIKGVLPRDAEVAGTSKFYQTLNLALEEIEEQILIKNQTVNTKDCLQFLDHDDLKTQFTSFCEQVDLKNGESFVHNSTDKNDLYFLLKGECAIQTLKEGQTNTVARVFTGALIGELSHYSNEGVEVVVSSLQESSLLRLSAESIKRMRVDNLNLHNLLNEFLIKVLRDHLYHAKKLIDSNA